MNTRRVLLIATTIGLTLAACGTSDSSSTTASDPAPVATGAAPADDFTETADTEAAPGTGVPATAAPAATATPEVPATEPPPTEPEPVPLGGRSFATSVEPAAQFEGNPFPDLVVDDVGRGGEANIANILPSDRPVLLWTWAPH